MLKKRIVPKLLIKRRQLGPIVRPVLVTTRRYEEVIEVGDPVSQAKIYEAQLADELAVINIDNVLIGQDETMLELIERLASETFMPLAVGGGVRSVEDFGRLLDRGADKVTINRAALADPQMVSRAAERYGSQCVVVSIDYRRLDGVPVVLDRNPGSAPRPALDWAIEVSRAGAGEILLTDADRDGTGAGLDVELGRAVADAVAIPVILSGGCGLAAHFTEGFMEGHAEAVAAGTFFCFRDQSPMQARAHVRNAGVPIRMST